MTMMSAQASLDLPDDDGESFLLTQIDLFNWGSFGNWHSAEIDPRGTALIGPTGSGKTTLVDALMTLITQSPRYNLASTGGHESDRDLISYVRGVAGAGNDRGDDSHIARSGRTTTAISARFQKDSQCIRVAGLFWIDSTATSASDLKRVWIFSQYEAGPDEPSLTDWLALHHEGGNRVLKQHARETPGMQVNDSKKAYLAHLKRFFEVSDNAFDLLNRAAGLKQLNSIDEIFRELVLDDRSAYVRAAGVAGEFDDLSGIHSELDTARRQQQALQPVADLHKRYQTVSDELDGSLTLVEILPRWFASEGLALWQAERGRLGEAVSTGKTLIEQIAMTIGQQQEEADALKDRYLQAGGASVEQLRSQIVQQDRWVQERDRFAKDYQRLAKSLELPETLDAASLSANQAECSHQLRKLEDQTSEEKAAVLSCAVAQHEVESGMTNLSEEIKRIKTRPGSNIDSRFQDFRSELAAELNLEDDALPFVAELVEVKSEASDWRGAIERAIGSNRLRILVPAAAMKTALGWVNSRNNRLHVRLLEASAPASAPRFMEDGFTHKLNFKAHPHREALKALLAGIDRHCVDSPEILRQTEHGMTREGLLSGRKGFFEKRDEQPLDRGWMTGFDNRDRLRALATELDDLQSQEQLTRHALKAAEARQQALQLRIQMLEQLNELTFESIDLPGAEFELSQLESRLAALTSPDSDLEQARREYQRVADILKATREASAKETSEVAVLQSKLVRAQQRCTNLESRLGGRLSDEQQTLGARHFMAMAADHIEQLEDLEREALVRLNEASGKLRKQVQGLALNLTQMMGKALAVDTGALAEAGTALQDVPVYLERLRLLTEEALPEKLARFLAYLNQSSDQGVTQLLSSIMNEVSAIEERIADLNETLRRVDFQPGRYLRLVPVRVTHESLRTLERAQRQLRADALKDDQGESHFKALENLVGLLRDASENKRTVGARALLDPRYRLQFSVSVMDRQNDEALSTQQGSQGGSGGEKEIFASYILIASLSYALCPDGASRPLFGTIILDEAFSKSSHAVAGRIVSALREFGLHPLFVTPNKEMQLLRTHTRSAILVHRKNQQSTLTSMSWEVLEAHAESRRVNEVTEVTRAL